MSLEQATRIIDRLVMEQPIAWRPDFVKINERYILLGYGTVTQGRSNAVVIGSALVGASTDTTRASSERVYFESTDKIALYSWKRKFKQWYVVSLVGKNRQHILRTRYLDEAERMADALQVVLNNYQQSP
jgi:hypothetical protein